IIEVLLIQHHDLNTMASAQFVFYLTCLFLGEMAQMNHLNIPSLVHQDRGFLSANTGDSVTLRCFYRDDILARFYWYKQISGQKLRLISMFHKYETEATFYDEFKSNPRFTLDTEKGKNHLTITDVHTSDSATYYCAGSYSYTFELAEGTTLNVKVDSLVSVHILWGALAITTILSIFQAFIMCVILKRNRSKCKDEENIHYAALKHNKVNRSRNQRNTETECVYSGIKQ
uniref:Ig-like domain-containing protein n=1 Tax=Amphiprion ocellaris TaxID=80972 RepID=A0AAQ5X7Q2_AMPOC